jgi:hypothetical protein
MRGATSENQDSEHGNDESIHRRGRSRLHGHRSSRIATPGSFSFHPHACRFRRSPSSKPGDEGIAATLAANADLLRNLVNGYFGFELADGADGKRR